VVDPAACVDRFRRVADDAGATVTSHPITAAGPQGEELAVDIAVVGAGRPDRALVVLSGVHGVEAFAPSEAQCGLLGGDRLARLPDDAALVVVHGVNPWGMAHGRRQNESNVDLNRNWGRDSVGPAHHAPYEEVHHLVCPDGGALPSFDELLTALAPLVADHGVEWVADAITHGQYRHPDGLHFGGDRTEESCAVLERSLPGLLERVSWLMVVDLHTGHGPHGEMAFLATAPVGSEEDVLLRRCFGEVESSDAGDVNAKSGQIARGITTLVPDAFSCSVTAEVGTTDALEQLAATFHEHWVFRHGDADDPVHRAARRRYRENFTPDDPEWEVAARAGLAATLDAALAALID